MFKNRNTNIAERKIEKKKKKERDKKKKERKIFIMANFKITN